MAWKVEFGRAAREDLLGIYRHLVATNRDFGHSLTEAKGIARERLFAIEAQGARLSRAPFRGTRHEIGGLHYRHVTIDRAIYWFTLDEAREVLRVEAIFFSGQDHAGRMFARLTSEGEGGEAPEGPSP